MAFLLGLNFVDLLLNFASLLVEYSGKLSDSTFVSIRVCNDASLDHVLVTEYHVSLQINPVSCVLRYCLSQPLGWFFLGNSKLNLDARLIRLRNRQSHTIAERDYQCECLDYGRHIYLRFYHAFSVNNGDGKSARCCENRNCYDNPKRVHDVVNTDN